MALTVRHIIRELADDSSYN
ncbi:uncharacterized protein G2W53_017886 [Senna tora]|uniref:Uncharacterized protein n=1 Tax=Senna tora TaxID=362788 RepID=A0A834SGY6_9FABA|nr:uncharacterized protein G2W53_041356 [Senna tora]KAF7826722.1 uncharacterized protein G2W53_017886 [Senna tora]